MQKTAQIFLTLSVFFAVWGTSGTRPVSGSIMLALAAAAFVFSIISWLNDSSRGFDELAKNPFLIGGALLVAMGVAQVLNPHTLAYDADGFLHAQPLKHISWLPSGILADAEVYGSAKAVAELLSAYFFACALWLNSRSRKFCRFILKFFALNISAMAAFAIIQQKLNAQSVYFVFPTDSHFFGPYYYGNAASAAIFMGICAAFAAAALDFSSKSPRSKIFCALWILAAAPGIFALYHHSSLGAKAACALFLGAMALYFAFVFLRSKFGGAKACAAASILILISAFAVFFAAQNCYQKLPPTKKTSVLARAELLRVSKEVFLKAPILGSGADSYGYEAAKLEAENSFGGKFANSAHCSIASCACEYGAAGLCAVFIMFLTWLKRLWHKREFLAGANIICLMGLAASALHSLADIFLQIPSTMFFFALLMALSASILKEAENGR
ncbi:MAG: O-antigen ligase family protein [Opitutales bacterium]|nr:O-antigen ligase family protein [Opitutales bacterium]